MILTSGTVFAFFGNGNACKAVIFTALYYLHACFGVEILAVQRIWRGAGSQFNSMTQFPSLVDCILARYIADQSQQCVQSRPTKHGVLPHLELSLSPINPSCEESC